MDRRFFESHWNSLAQFGAIVASAIGGFWLPATEDAREVAFATFVLYLSVGLMLIPTWKYASKRHLKVWTVVGVALLIACLAAFFSYQHFFSRWTCAYANGVKVVGTAGDLTAQGAKFFRENPSATNKDAVMSHGGNVALIWNSEAVDQRRQRLGFMYVVSGPLFAAALIAVIQAAYCARRRS